MAAGRKNTRKADVESKAATAKAVKAPEETKTPEKAVEDKVDKEPDVATVPSGDVEMVANDSKPEPKKGGKKAAPKKTETKAKPDTPPAEAAEDAEMEELENPTETAAPEEPTAEPKKSVVEPAADAPVEDAEMKEEAAKPKKAGRAKVSKAVAKAAEPAKAAEATRGVKRARPAKEDVNVTKRAKLDENRMALRGPHLQSVAEEGGVVLCVGQGDTGQIGLGPDVMEASKPKVVTHLDGKPVVAISAGGMHSLALTIDGVVYSFGCNDDGALGRLTEDDDETYTPGEVKLDGKIIQICAGDSHSAALTSEGKVYYWGTFRDNSGTFGLTPDGQNQPLPIPLAHHLKVRKIVSGENHIGLLTEDGQLYTLGCAEQGRLGRVGELFVGRGGRRGLSLPLLPDIVHAKNRRVVFADVWAGSMSTVALTNDNEVLVCGLNNYSQLGIEKKTEIFIMDRSPALSTIAEKYGLSQVVFGQHHVMLLDSTGKVYSLGRHDYGVLGLGEGITTEVHVPTQVRGELETQACVEIACGTSVSFAVTTTGDSYSWGMGTNLQLSHSGDDDALVPTRMIGQQLTNRKVVGVSSGGQHTILLAQPKPE